VTSAELLNRLTEHKTLGGAPRPELEWLVAHGSFRQLPAGQTVAVMGQPLLEMYVILHGHIAIFVDRGAGRHKVMEWRTGEVTGTLPYSRMTVPPGNSMTQEPTDVLAISRDEFPALIRECHEITSILVHKMLDRARVFTSSALQDERLVSLGKLSAGLAHELNNPASAIERNAALLDDRLRDAEQAARALGAARLVEAQQAAVDALRIACVAAPVQGVLSPIQQAEREDLLTDWLTDHGITDDIAGPLSDTGITVDSLDQLAGIVDPSALVVALRWAAADCLVHSLAADIQHAAMRITGLVSAVKGFAHMDQAMVAEPVELQTSLRNTVAVLNAKARSKSVSITITVPPDLPRVRGFIGELNQIWANLIDNALDAVPESGRVDVTAAHERRGVVVRVIDNGSGIPPEVRDRIFDPFVTTKPVGKGTGLGLDIVRRLIHHNDAEIEVNSVPGRTEFSVTLPLAEAPGAAAVHE
jgi:signal transduction histidine kinase